MNRIAPFLLALVCSISEVHAQAPKMTDAGRLILQFQEAISPGVFVDQWPLKTQSWRSTAAKTSTGKALAGNATFLMNYIKPAMFKNSFNRANFVKAANGVKSYADAYKVLRDLEDGLNPAAFMAGWPRYRGNWLHDLSLLR